MRIQRFQPLSSLVAAAIFITWMLPVSPARATPTTVTLSGTVVGVSTTGDPVPLEGVTVSVDGSYSASGSALTDSTGSFSIDATYASKIRVLAKIANPSLELNCYEGNDYQTSPLFNQLEKSDNEIWVYGEPVISVFEPSSDGDPTTGLTIEMQRPDSYGTLSGTLIDQNGAPLEVTQQSVGCRDTPAKVNVYSTDGTLLSQSQSNGGAYSIGLLPGTYYLSVGDPSLNVSKSYYGSATDMASSQAIEIIADQQTSNVNFQATTVGLFNGNLEANIDYSDLIVGRSITAKVAVPVESGSSLTIALQHVTCPGDPQTFITYSECTYVPIAGATKTTTDPTATESYKYVLKSSDIGSMMGVKATLTKPGFKSQEALSVVLFVSGPIKVLALPKISGLVKVGKSLKPILPKFKGIKPNSYEYLWLACDTLAKAKRATPSICTWLENPTWINNANRLVVPKAIKGKYLVLQIWSHDNVAGTRIITTSKPSKVK
ncbi:MAG: hypothetical protein RL196_1362 [Actinomycetota bacterium]|jgi:hypothetical protein